MNIKKIILISLFTLLSFSLSAEPYISGKLLINDTSTISKSIDTIDINELANAALTLDMSVKSNGVKFYSQGVFSATNKNNISANLSKAYIKYRIPNKDNYINFQIGKSYYSLGGGLIYNAGNPLYDTNYAKNLSLIVPNKWSAITIFPLNQSDYYNLYLGTIYLIPLENNGSGGGLFLNLEIGNTYFDNVEVSFVARDNKSLLTFGYKGALYFDYGIFSNIDFNNTEDFNISLFATKIYDKVTFNIEALYENKNNHSFNISPSIIYQIDDKIGLNLTNTTSISYLNKLIINNTFVGTLSYSIVQGLNFGNSISTSFNDSNLATFGFSMNFEF